MTLPPIAKGERVRARARGLQHGADGPQGEKDAASRPLVPPHSVHTSLLKMGHLVQSKCKVRTTPGLAQKLATSSLVQPCFQRTAWANLHLLGQID
jgi:hypothetical protein